MQRDIYYISTIFSKMRMNNTMTLFKIRCGLNGVNEIDVLLPA